VNDVTNSRNPFLIVAIIGAIGGYASFSNGRTEIEHVQKSISQSTVNAEIPETSPGEFAGYQCTEDCSGHEAGYKWAEEHGISDVDDCDTAGEHSNSPSFAEGCRAYVERDSGSEKDEDSNDENAEKDEDPND
jgi:hypothetical protein